MEKDEKIITCWLYRSFEAKLTGQWRYSGRQNWLKKARTYGANFCYLLALMCFGFDDLIVCLNTFCKLMTLSLLIIETD